MTHSNFKTMLRRATERFTAGVGAIALTACLLAVSDARASTTDSVFVGPSVTVQYDTAALASGDGTRQVYRRLKAAARQVCGVTSGHTALAQRLTADKCFDAALTEAVRRVDRPQLSALHQSTASRRVS